MFLSLMPILGMWWPAELLLWLWELSIGCYQYEETKQFIKDDIVEERRKNADVSDEHRKLFER